MQTCRSTAGSAPACLRAPGMRGYAFRFRWLLVFRARLRPARSVAKPVPAPLAVPSRAPLSGLRQPPRRARTLPARLGAAPALRFGTAPPRPPPAQAGPRPRRGSGQPRPTAWVVCLACEWGAAAVPSFWGVGGAGRGLVAPKTRGGRLPPPTPIMQTSLKLVDQ